MKVCYDVAIGEGTFQYDEGLVTGRGPFESVVLLQQAGHRRDFLGVVSDEVAVEVAESAEDLKSLTVARLFQLRIASVFLRSMETPLTGITIHRNSMMTP